jgi:hypothetical protein
MVKGPILRWAFLLSALGVAVVLVFGPSQQMGEAAEVVAPAARRVVPSQSISVEIPSVSTKSSNEEKSDPFTPRQWRAVEPAATPTPAPITQPPAQVLAAPPSTPQPPAMPYKFIGQMDDGGRLVLYLGRGEQVFLGRLGETIEGEYKITAITPSQITFEYLPAGTTQILSIPASQ